MKTKVLNLKNNIKLIYTYVKDVNGVDVQLCFNAGALNDPKGKSGLAHFCEHALASAFSTEKHNRNERRSLKNKYTYSNASTSSLYVKFLLQVAHDKFEEAFDLMTEPFYSLKYIEKEFESERKIIYDELLTKRKTNEREIYNIFLQKLHKEHEFNNMQAGPGGSVESVGKIKIEDIKNYIEKYFTQKNLTIVISGKITLREILKNINKYIYSRIPLGETLGFDFENYKGFKSPCFIKSPSVEEGKSLFLLFYAYDTYEKFSNRRLFFLENLLESCLHEKFFEYYRTNQNLCYSCFASLYNNNIYKICDFTVLCNDNNIKEVISQFKNFLISFDKEYDIELFNKQKERKLSQVNFDLQNLSNISCSRFGELNSYNEICNDDNKIKSEINSITFEETKELWEKILKVKPYLILITSKEDFDNFDYKKFVKR